MKNHVGMQTALTDVNEMHLQVLKRIIIRNLAIQLEHYQKQSNKP